MNAWLDALYAELDQWNFDGVAATFWWRDDDAQAASPPLDRALALARQYHAPLALAVIPHGLAANLAARIKALTAVAVLQHGFAHANYAPAGEKKSELGDHRAAAAIGDELAQGRDTLRAAFEAQFVAVLTPPWNRIAAPLVAKLPAAGFIGISTFAPRAAAVPAPGLRAANTHVDLIDWKDGRCFIGAPRAIEALTTHLRGRRLGQHDSAEPTGILTHHLVHDAATWEFLAQLLAALDDHPAVKWKTAAAIFAE